MKALAIDTSNYTLGIAVLNSGSVVGEFITNLKKNHSVRAMPAIEELLKECGITPAELEKVIVANGPGSYTGVRIGVTIAKTLAWSLNIPAVPVSSLEVLAANGRFFNGFICPLFDARRGQVYTGLYRYQNREIECTIEDQNILLTDWIKQLKKLDEPVLFLGSDLTIHKKTIEEEMGSQAFFGEATQHNPRPSELALIGLNKETVNVHALVPNYIRLAEAEAKWLEEQK